MFIEMGIIEVSKDDPQYISASMRFKDCVFKLGTISKIYDNDLFSSHWDLNQDVHYKNAKSLFPWEANKNGITKLYEVDGEIAAVGLVYDRENEVNYVFVAEKKCFTNQKALP